MKICSGDTSNLQRLAGFEREGFGREIVQNVHVHVETVQPYVIHRVVGLFSESFGDQFQESFVNQISESLVDQFSELFVNWQQWKLPENFLRPRPGSSATAVPQLSESSPHLSEVRRMLLEPYRTNAGHFDWLSQGKYVKMQSQIDQFEPRHL
jgi:hypothetical protein